MSKVELADKSTDSNRRIEVVLRIEKRFQNMISDDSTASLAVAAMERLEKEMGNDWATAKPIIVQ